MSLRFLIALAFVVSCGSEQSLRRDEPAKESSDGEPEEQEELPKAGKMLDASITPTREAATPAPMQGTTYSEHVRPILARWCVTCHSEGNIAPFSLESYDQAKPFASLMAKATRARTMPPSVVDNTGACNTFRDLPWLSEAEIETFTQWAEADAPEGPSLPAPPIKTPPALSGDLKKFATPAYRPKTDKGDDYRCFVIDSPFDEQTFVTGYDVHPGDPKTAHHMVIFYPMDDGAGVIARLLDQLEDGPGYTCFGGPGTPATLIAGWAPGAGATKYPDKLGVPVAPGRPLIVQMHYNTTSSPMPPEASVNVELEVEKSGILEGAFPQMLDLEMSLPPGQTDALEVVSDSIASSMSNAKGPIQVYGVFPHMHELGKTLTVTFGKEDTCLVDAPRYSFHWQRMYFFEKPVTIDADDEIKVHCHYDTTSRDTTTAWGEGTQDEMCVTGFFVKR